MVEVGKDPWKSILQVKMESHPSGRSLGAGIAAQIPSHLPPKGGKGPSMWPPQSEGWHNPEHEEQLGIPGGIAQQTSHIQGDKEQTTSSSCPVPNLAGFGVYPRTNSCCFFFFIPLQEAAEIYPRPYASVWRSLYCFHGYAIHRRVRDSLASSNAL